jgi:predicted permease
MTSMQMDRPVPLAAPMLHGLRTQNDVFEGVLGRYRTNLNLTVDASAESIDGELVTGSFFEVLRLQPAVGRLFTLDDDRTVSGHPVVVLSHAFWQRRFAGDPKVVGRTLGVNSHPMTVVGVAPAGFHGVEVGASTDAWVPVSMLPQVLPTWRRTPDDWRLRFLVSMARLREGVTRQSAEPRLGVVYARLLAEDLDRIESQSQDFRTRFLQKKLVLHPGGRGPSSLREQSETPLLVLMGMVGLVLLIACANVANLLLVRASSRQKEIAMRLAMGAGRGRLVRQLLVEAAVFASAGAGVGLAFASWTSAVLLRALPFDDAAAVLSTEPDLRVALFTTLLAVATTLAFGLVPALSATRPALAPVLKSESAAVAGGGSPFRLRKGLVVAQIALSLLLLVGAGLFTRSLLNLRRVDPGFQTERLVSWSVDPSLNGYENSQRMQVIGRIQQALAAEPGVLGAAVAELGVLTQSNWGSTVKVEGYEAKEGEDLNPNFNGVSAGYFETLAIPLLRGREFSDSDVLGAPRVAIVNQEFARYFYGGEDPIGRSFALASAEDVPITIVGLVPDVKTASLREERERFVYLPWTQQESLGSVTFYARTASEPGPLQARAQRLVSGVDPQLPVTQVETMELRIGESLYVERVVAALSACFGLLATLLAAVGLYGVMSHAVAARTREIGIRMALGAERREVLRLVLHEVVALTTLGVVLGLPSGYALGRAVESQLFGTLAYDPPTFAVATSALVAASLLAGWVPARRATQVDPMVALRYE